MRISHQPHSNIMLHKWEKYFSHNETKIFSSDCYGELCFDWLLLFFLCQSSIVKCWTRLIYRYDLSRILSQCQHMCWSRLWSSDDLFIVHLLQASHHNCSTGEARAAVSQLWGHYSTISRPIFRPQKQPEDLYKSVYFVTLWSLTEAGFVGYFIKSYWKERVGLVGKFC